MCRADLHLLGLLSAGHVLRWRRTVPRLAPEAVALMFERVLDSRRGTAASPKISVLDPCCGNGVVLAVLQVAYPAWVASLRGSDACVDAVEVTRHNLAILNDRGRMNAWIDELENRVARTGSRRLVGAIADARELASLAAAERPTVRIGCWNALAEELAGRDAGDSSGALGAPVPGGVDLVLTDPPYGRRSGWIGTDLDADDGMRLFLGNAGRWMSPDGRIALALDPAVKLPDVDGLEVEDRLALPRRAGWILKRRNEPVRAEPQGSRTDGGH